MSSPNEKDNKRNLAFQDFKDGMKYKDIAKKYDVAESTVKSWAIRHWKPEIEKEKLRLEEERVATPKKKVATQKRMGPPYGNQNAKGHGPPKENQNAVKHGLFRRYLPADTQEIMEVIQEMDPLELLWHQIQLSYASILRAQKISYVKDIEDTTTDIIASGASDMYAVQHAWEKQGRFMEAQARAQAELRNMIRQYDEMLHKDWDMYSEEQKARVEVLKAKTQTDSKESDLVKAWTSAVLKKRKEQEDE